MAYNPKRQWQQNVKSRTISQQRQQPSNTNSLMELNKLELLKMMEEGTWQLMSTTCEKGKIYLLESE